MSKLLLMSVGLSLACSVAAAATEGNSPLFLNRVGETIVKLQFAPVRTAKWGPDQCQYEDEKSVRHNKKLPLMDVKPGRYNVRFTDLKGRICTVKNLSVRGDALVVLRENELPPCTRTREGVTRLSTLAPPRPRRHRVSHGPRQHRVSYLFGSTDARETMPYGIKPRSTAPSRIFRVTRPDVESFVDYHINVELL